MRLGVTGNIGSGKSTVARELGRLGAAVIDADALAREAVRDDRVKEQLAAAFGPDVFVDGELDRTRLGAIVFGDARELEQLNAITHPWIRQRSDELVRQHEGAAVIVQDIPLLYENGLEAGLDAVVVVTAPLEERVRRVMQRSGLTREQVLERDARQMPLEDKAARADHVIDNARTPQELLVDVRALWEKLTRG